MSENQIKKTRSRKFRMLVSSNSYLIVILFCAAIAVLITFFLQSYTNRLLRERLNERLTAIASTASLLISGDEIDKLHSMDIDAAKTDIYKKNVFLLQAIRSANKNILYAYIIGKTDDPNIVEFIVDADAATLDPTSDNNNDGVIDEEDVSKPGDDYDATDYPGMRGEAFTRPSVEKELSVDDWGILLSAYAPIFNSQGDSVAALAIDVEVSDFQALVDTTFVPFLLFVVVLILLITFLTVFLIRIWKSRVDIMKELDRQKDELLGIVAHQLAKPITAIRWDLESLLDGDLGQMNEKQKTETNIMRGQAVNLADLVSMILDVSRIQLGRIQLAPQPLNLNEFFTEILQVVQPQIVQKKLNFVKHMPKTLPTVLLDKRYTRMTVENMLTNAVKYTPDGGNVTFDLKIEKGIMRCSVSDTGCGIPKEEQGKIFGKMYRASNVRNTVEGNGFGLYVAKGAIEGQGGKMWFTSEVGKGTTFSFELPMKEDKNPTSEAAVSE
ncbi:HAMP domain-containing histidine kinase [Candidatus Peribacteria bacterium]|nr:HAMP domain-containing histidine kinase [Candidatus Peribacteria bacterium]